MRLSRSPRAVSNRLSRDEGRASRSLVATLLFASRPRRAAIGCLHASDGSGGQGRVHARPVPAGRCSRRPVVIAHGPHCSASREVPAEIDEGVGGSARWHRAPWKRGRRLMKRTGAVATLQSLTAEPGERWARARANVPHRRVTRPAQLALTTLARLALRAVQGRSVRFRAARSQWPPSPARPRCVLIPRPSSPPDVALFVPPPRRTTPRQTQGASTQSRLLGLSSESGPSTRSELTQRLPQDELQSIVDALDVRSSLPRAHAPPVAQRGLWIADSTNCDQPA